MFHFRASLVLFALLAATMLPSTKPALAGIPLEVINNTSHPVWVTFYYAGRPPIKRHIVAAGMAEPRGAYRADQRIGNLIYWARAEVKSLKNRNDTVCDTIGEMWEGRRYVRLLTWYVHYNGHNCWLDTR